MTYTEVHELRKQAANVRASRPIGQTIAMPNSAVLQPTYVNGTYKMQRGDSLWRIRKMLQGSNWAEKMEQFKKNNPTITSTNKIPVNTIVSLGKGAE